MALARMALVLLASSACATTLRVEPLAAPSSPVLDTAGPGTIAGVVVDSTTEERLPDALVILISSALPETREAQTNAEGIYVFRDLPAGAYTIEVLAGAADVSKVTQLPADGRFRADFRVDPINAPRIGCTCGLGLLPGPTESLFYIDAREARLLGVPKTTRILH